LVWPDLQRRKAFFQNTFSRQDLAHDAPGRVRQAKVATAEAKRQPFVVQPQQMQ